MFKKIEEAARKHQVKINEERKAAELRNEQEFTKDQIRMLVGELKRQVHIKNRIDLYNKEQIGLNTAIKSGAIDVLHSEGDSAFYAKLVDGKQAVFTEIVGKGEVNHGGSFSAVEAVDEPEELNI